MPIYLHDRIYSGCLNEAMVIMTAGTENSWMAGLQEQRFEELFGGFFFDEDALRYCKS
jgi:hypothetical protein